MESSLSLLCIPKALLFLNDRFNYFSVVDPLTIQVKLVLMNLFDFQLIRRKMVKTAKESIRKRETSSQVYENMQEVFIEMDKSPLVSSRLIIQCSGERKIKI